MLRVFTRSHQCQLAALAQAWLDSGALEFEVWEAGQSLAHWARPADGETAEEGWLLQPISEDGGACLRVRLPVGGAHHSAAARLAADAALLNRLLRQEEDLGALTAELIETQDQLLALYDLAKATRNHLDIPETLESLAQASVRLLKCECAAVVLLGPTGEVLVGKDGPLAMPDCRQQLARTVQQAVSEGRELSFSTPVKSAATGETLVGLRNVFVVPIEVCEGWRAGLALANKGEGALPSPERKLARAIAEQAGGQIENVLLYQETLKNTRLETEMELARSVQMRLLPQRLPAAPGLDIWAGTRPALRVGGDLYDFVLRPAGPLIFTAGDVSGKGAAAALLMSMTRAVFRSATGATAFSPVDIISHVNTLLYDDLSAVASFVTLFVGQFDARVRRLTYANAGHAPVIYCQAGKHAVLLEADGPAVGVLPVTMSQNQALTLDAGDVLVVATDGFNESQDESGEMYGIERMLRDVEMLARKPAQDVALGLYQSVEAFAHGHERDDDQTLVVLKGVAA